MNVLVLHQGWPAALYLAAELARLGVRPTLAGSGVSDLLSGYAQEQVHAEAKSAEGRLQLARLLRDTAWDAVVATTDDFFAALAGCSSIDPDKVWPRADPGVAGLLRDRRAVDALVGSLGVQVPACSDANQAGLPRALALVGTPCIVRGTAGQGGSQVRFARDAPEVRAALAELAPASPGPTYLQAYVPGPTILVGGLYERGRCLQSYAAEKLESHPPPFGPSVRVRSIRAAAATRLTNRIFERLGFHGLAFAEFKQPPDAEPVFIELNPRPWGSVRGARAAGIDFLALAARQILGLRPEPERAPIPGREAALFPQYLGAIIERGGLRGADLRPALRSLAAAPWRDPKLALHYLRGLWWERAAHHRKHGSRGVAFRNRG